MLCVDWHAEWQIESAPQESLQAYFFHLLMNYFTLEQHDNVMEGNMHFNWSNWFRCSRVGFLSVLFHHMSL